MSRADQYERYMLELINAERAKVGAPALQLEQRLNDAAAAHSLWMLRTDIFDHTGVDGSSPTQRMRDADFDLSGSWRTAENIAVQSERGPDGIMDDVANLHTSLMNSPGHRANILNPDLDYIGIGIELGEFDFNSGTYTSVIVTQNFASTGGNVVLDTNSAPAAPAQTPVIANEKPTVVETTDTGEDTAPAAAAAPVPAQTEETAPAATPVAAVAGVTSQFGGLDTDVIGFFDLDTSEPAATEDFSAMAVTLFRDSLKEFEDQVETTAAAGLDALAV